MMDQPTAARTCGAAGKYGDPVEQSVIPCRVEQYVRMMEIIDRPVIDGLSNDLCYESHDRVVPDRRTVCLDA